MRMEEIQADYSADGTADVDLGSFIFSVRAKGYSPRAELENVLFLEQVHGSDILISPSESRSADGAVMAVPGRVPGIRTADCLPVFLGSADYIAGGHAGWRGLADGIAGNLLRSFPGTPEIVVLGNCICGRCYEVGPEVTSALKEWIPVMAQPSATVSLKRAALAQLVSAGLPQSTRVVSFVRCTLCRNDILYSYRADATSGRNLSWLRRK